MAKLRRGDVRLFKNKQEAQSFMNEKYSQAKLITRKSERRTFWLELKASVEFRSARAFLGKQKLVQQGGVQGKYFASMDYGRIENMLHSRSLRIC